MFTDPSTAFPAHSHVRPVWHAARRDDYQAPRVIVGHPIGAGRVAYVRQLGVPLAPAVVPAADVRISLFGQRPGGPDGELLLHVDIRRCDLWNGDFDVRLKAVVLSEGWAVTRIERRDLAACAPAVGSA
jgi:hypothetical protein